MGDRECWVRLWEIEGIWLGSLQKDFGAEGVRVGGALRVRFKVP